MASSPVPGWHSNHVGCATWIGTYLATGVPGILFNIMQFSCNEIREDKEHSGGMTKKFGLLHDGKLAGSKFYGKLTV